MNRDEEDDLSLLAAEYVIGLSPLLSRRRIEHRMRREARLRAEINFWEERLGHLNSYYGEQPAPPSVKIAVDERLFYRRWRAVKMLGAAVAVLTLIALPFIFTQQSSKSERLFALLHDPSTGYSFDVSVSRDRNDIEITLSEGQLPEGRSFELWVVTTDAPPTSLGTFHHETKTSLPEGLPNASTIAVSLEPTNGSPTGLPTGTVVAAGQLPDD